MFRLWSGDVARAAGSHGIGFCRGLFLGCFHSYRSTVAIAVARASNKNFIALYLGERVVAQGDRVRGLSAFFRPLSLRIQDFLLPAAPIVLYNVRERFFSVIHLYSAYKAPPQQNTAMDQNSHRSL